MRENGNGFKGSPFLMFFLEDDTVRDEDAVKQKVVMPKCLKVEE